MYNKEKMLKYIEGDMVVMLILQAVIFLVDVLFTPLAFEMSSKIGMLIFVVLLAFGIYYAKKGNKIAGILCLIAGILLVISGGIINILLGAFMIIHSIIFLVNYDKNENNK